jgi:hypothetical protein
VRTERRGCGEDAYRAAGVRRGCGGGADCAGVRRGGGWRPFLARAVAGVESAVDGDVLAAALLGARGCACASAAAFPAVTAAGSRPSAAVARTANTEKSRRAWEGASYLARLENLTCPFSCGAFFLSLRLGR